MKLPKEPPPGLLMSMAIRYDHALAVPGYYDQPFFKEMGECPTHKERLEGALQVMSQLYEEVAGYGFYSKEGSGYYVALMPVDKKKVWEELGKIESENPGLTNLPPIKENERPQ